MYTVALLQLALIDDDINGGRHEKVGATMEWSGVGWRTLGTISFSSEASGRVLVLESACMHGRWACSSHGGRQRRAAEEEAGVKSSEPNRPVSRSAFSFLQKNKKKKNRVGQHRPSVS